MCGVFFNIMKLLSAGGCGKNNTNSLVNFKGFLYLGNRTPFGFPYQPVIEIYFSQLFVDFLILFFFISVCINFPVCRIEINFVIRLFLHTCGTTFCEKKGDTIFFTYFISAFISVNFKPH